MMLAQTKPKEGGIQSQISISVRRFIKAQAYPKEPVYKTLDRIIARYLQKDIAPVEDENRRMKVSLQAALKRNDEMRKEIMKMSQQIEKLNRLVNGTKLTEFLE